MYLLVRTRQLQCVGIDSDGNQGMLVERAYLASLATLHGVREGVQIYHSLNFFTRHSPKTTTQVFNLLHVSPELKTDIIQCRSQWTFVYFHLQLKWLNPVCWFSRGVWKEDECGWERFTQRLQTRSGKPFPSRSGGLFPTALQNTVRAWSLFLLFLRCGWPVSSARKDTT